MKLETLYSMKPIKYIFVNETTSPSPTPAFLGSISADFRHCHIISAAGLTHPELIGVLLLARKQWSSAKILGISELGLEIHDQRIVSFDRLCPSDSMNLLRRELSELP